MLTLQVKYRFKQLERVGSNHQLLGLSRILTSAGKLSIFIMYKLYIYSGKHTRNMGNETTDSSNKAKNIAKQFTRKRNFDRSMFFLNQPFIAIQHKRNCQMLNSTIRTNNPESTREQSLRSPKLFKIRKYVVFSNILK